MTYDDDDGRMIEWASDDGIIVMRRHTGYDFVDGEMQPIDRFGFFYRNREVCVGTFTYCSRTTTGASSLPCNERLSLHHYRRDPSTRLGTTSRSSTGS